MKYGIKQIAELSGVSPATVSRVINGTGKVEESKKTRVLQVIEKTNYVPNKIAKSLFSKSSKILGYIVPNITNPFFNEVGRYMEQYAFEKGYHLILCNSNNNPEKEIEYMRNLISMNCDGIIIITNNTKNAEASYAPQIPIVVVDRDLKNPINCITVKSNHKQGGRLAVEHLYERGCKNIAYLAPIEEYSPGILRYNEYLKFCKEKGLDEITVDCKFLFEDGLVNTRELLDKYPYVDGIICANDLVAMATYKVLYERGLTDKVKIIGYDNILGSVRVTPSLTTIGQPIEELGKIAIKELIEQIENKTLKQKEIVLPTELIIRQTT